MKISQKIKIFGIVCGITLVLTGVTVCKDDQKDGILRDLQKKILDATNNVPGFDLSIPKIIKDGVEKLSGDKERFTKLIMTMDDDRLTIISHLVIEYDPSELEETLDMIQKFFGPDYKPIAYLLRHRDDGGRSALYFAVLRKNNDMLTALLKKAEKIFGKDKKEFLLFINGENEQGRREHLNYRTPFILAAYNDDSQAVTLLLQTALRIFGRQTKNFSEFLHARDANGATAAFYARDATKKASRGFGIPLGEFSE